MKRAALVALLRDLEVPPHVLREAADELEAMPANDARQVAVHTAKPPKRRRERVVVPPADVSDLDVAAARRALRRAGL